MANQALPRDRDSMSETQKPEERKLSLRKPGKLEGRKAVEAGQVRQSFSHGRSKAVTVEVKKKRSVSRATAAKAAAPRRATKPKEVAEPATPHVEEQLVSAIDVGADAAIEGSAEQPARGRIILRDLTEDEKHQLADIAHNYKRRGKRTSETQIHRIAVNFILQDYKANGEHSVLDRVIRALLA